MLIPSIDLRNGQVVQLVQGKRLALASDDVFAWVERFADFPVVQVIDLDAAMERGDNDSLVRQICHRLRRPGPSGPGRGVRAGGGIRSVARARAVLDAGATSVIAGSALFAAGQVNLAFARELAEAVGRPRVVAAVDSLGGRVVVRGWTEATPLTAVEAAVALEPYCGGFLYTHVDSEGLMGGIDMDAVRAVRAATSLPLAAAGGIATMEEVDRLQALGIDAVVGMAIYTGRMRIEPPGTAR